MENGSDKINYEKTSRIIYKIQLLVASCIFITEIVDNAVLYITRSQGYGPDTIQQKLIRYLLVPTIIDFGVILYSRYRLRKGLDIDNQKLVLIFSTTVICTNVAFTHYQFASVLVVFILPLLVSILYEDPQLSIVALSFALVGQTVAVVARAIDPLYNKDIIPEAAVAYTFTIGVFLISKYLGNTLITRREELSAALVSSEKANATLERAKLSLKMLETLARTIDAKDKYTNGHSSRVAIYATILAENLGWSEKQIEMLKYEALLHDIGKIGVPDSVLNKPDRLTATEFNIIKSHTLVGSDILKNMIAVPTAASVAKYHHERYDGNGYPSGLKGTDIPLDARIVCIADAYDAMSSDRIYRKALSEEIIRKELIRGRGTQFDPDLLDVFLKLFDAHKLVIKPDSIVSMENAGRRDHEYILNDIERVLRNLTDYDESYIAYNDFNKFYKYMRNIGLRYNRSVEVLSVTMISDSSDISLATQEDAASTLEVAIKKNIRAVDVYYRYSDFRHMIILLDAGSENIDIITHRIDFDFKTNEQSGKYDLTFEMNESIKA